MTSSPLVSIIIINFNGRKWLKNLFNSIIKQTYKKLEIIFVDNASNDDCLKFVSDNYHNVTVIRNKINLGFGKANNIGAQKAKGEILFFLNNDTLLEKDTVWKLVSYKAKNNLDILGPRLLDYKGKDMHQGKKLSIDYTGYIGYGKKIFYIDGCALMISKKDFISLGGFDEKYYMYSEDIDLCWRAHLYGMKIGTCSDTSIKHYCGGTGGTTLRNIKGKHQVTFIRRYEVEKNNLRNVLKNYKLINLMWVLPLFEIQSLGEAFVYLITGNFKASQVILKAHLWNFNNIKDTLYHRKIIQKKRVIDDQEILSKMCFRLNKLRAFINIGVPEFKNNG